MQIVPTIGGDQKMGVGGRGWRLQSRAEVGKCGSAAAGACVGGLRVSPEFESNGEREVGRRCLLVRCRDLACAWWSKRFDQG